VKLNLVPTWVKDYERSCAPLDLVAGLTVAALLVPEGMAYAQLAGVPPETAFYAAPIGLFLYALFGSSRQLVVAVSGAVAVLSASTVGEIAEPGSEEFIALTAALAMVAGAISLIAGLAKMGRLAQFFSESVLTGFIFGLALVIAVKQVPKLIGIEGEEGNFFERLWDIVINLDDAHGPTVVVGLSSLAAMVLIERYFERIPAALVVLIGGIIAGEVFDLAGDDVEVIGEVPSGLVGPALPDISASDVMLLIVGGLGITAVAFAEAVGPARGFAAEHGYEIDENRELVGIGAANLGAGLFQGFPIGSSLSKSAANDGAGAKTPMSLIVAAIATALVALFLTDTLTNLPEPALGAIVVVAVSGMMKVSKMQRLWRLSQKDFLFAATALLGVLLFDALPGLGVAVLLSLGWLVWQAATPNLAVMGRQQNTPEFVSLDEEPEAHTMPGLMLIRLKENLFFANAAAIRAVVKKTVNDADPRPDTVVLDLEATVDVDLPGCDELRELIEDLRAKDVTLSLTRVSQETRDLFDRAGVVEVLGADEIYPSNRAAVAGRAARTGRHRDAAVVLHRVAVELRGMADLMPDAEVADRMRRAASDLEPGDESNPDERDGT
jgi:SulP family sulfate permease